MKDYTDSDGVVVRAEGFYGNFWLVVNRFKSDQQLKGWFASCPGLFEFVLLDTKDLSEAKEQAKKLLLDELKQAISELEGASE